MSSAVVFSVLSLFWQSVHCTVFPPVSNPPPIPGQDFRALDISGQQFYVQDDLQAGIPQTVIKEDRFFSPTFESKPDDQWFVSDNESVVRDFPTSSEAFERLYANGMPAIGPVATPPPDDNYIAQSTGTSKILPDTVGNLDSGVFVLTKGPNNQFITERWIPMQVPASKTIDIVNTGENPNIVPENLPSAVPVKGFPVKSQGVPADNLNIGQQVWIRVPASAALQKGYPNVPTVVDNMSEVQEVVDVVQPSIKQSIQPQLVKGFPTFPSAPPQSPTMVINKSPINSIPPPSSSYVTNKSPSFVVPPPPPPIMKSIDMGNPKGTVMVNPTVSTIIDKGGVVGGKGTVAQQVKHIWIPSSQKTGNFITIPAGGAINENQPIISKGFPADAVPPMSVSETWVLKDDGVVPRFEQQKTLFPVQNVGKEKTIVADPPVFVDSPKGVPTIGKSVDTVMTQDIWPQKTDMIDGKTFVKSGLTQQVFPVPKSNAVVVEKAVQMPPQNVQNVLPMTKVVPMLPPQQTPFIPSSPMATLVKGKPPCPITPQAIMQGKPLPYVPYLPNSVQRQPMARIIRMNRYPFGSYYVVNPRMRPNLYPLPRQATIIKQVNNRIVRIIPSSSLPLNMPRRVTLPIRQMALPVTAGKTMMPMSRILYPPVQAVGRVRYAFPWGGYLNALPAFGRTASPSRPTKQVGIESSSSSSSSESAESREVPVKRKPKKAEKPKEKIKIIKLESEEKPIESLETIESVEPESEIVVEPEPELETAESVASETESEAVEADTTETAPEPETETEAEVPDSLDIAESQFIHNIAPRSYLDFNYENIKNLGQPYRFGYERRERPSTFLAQETPELNGRVLGRYTYKDENGIYRNIAYVSDNDSYKRELLNSESKLSNQKKISESLGKEHNTEVSTKPLENVSESPLPFNIAFNLQRD